MADNRNNLIDGRLIANKIKEELIEEINNCKKMSSKIPGLAVILVGNRTDSSTYVRMKQQTSQEIGLNFILIPLQETISEQDLISEIEKLNQNEQINGIIVQLPLPIHIDEKKVLKTVVIDKDVDGFHSENIGNLTMKGREPLFISCTPKACIELLDRNNVTIAGKHAVVIGRSNIVGIPISLLLLHRDATVTICHSKTSNLIEIVRQADIVIAAVGRAQMVKSDWIKPGAVVIDVGINSIPDLSRSLGYRLVGDVDFDQVKNVATLITPVPGGVGPVTVIMLIKNTILSFKRLHQIP
eukprot:TRINITY_DN980_c2_g1_i1.p1 TRINITY_DN980_c2_g1~~TRINITY_DN980_c2_g1_i1.p1  ORF type:complete len:333 (-),score=173.17 TRINITY_DN980_c2_g1_i1:80-973(-)